MKSWLWFCLVWLIAGCMLEPTTQGAWNGTYIGYYHRNQQDTTPVTFTFEGKYFAADPWYAESRQNAAGVFRQKESSLIFFNPSADSASVIQGTFQYQYGANGTVRIWRYPDDGGIVELILKQQ
jgi:hypothetical protein